MPFEQSDESGATPVDEKPASPEGAVPEAACILVIEDEAPVANFLREALELKGHRVVVATDGERGLELFHSERPDLVVCDLLLPKRNGFRLIEDFQRIAPAMPVVACTGIYRSERYRDELSHARLFLHKPLDLSHVDRIDRILADHVLEHGVNATRPEVAPASAPRRSREPWIPTSVLPLPRVLHLLWRERRTGLLTLRAGERDVIFMIEDGRLRFVRSSDPAQRLGHVLLKLGKLDAAALAEAERSLSERTTPTRLGEVLVESGALSQEDLDRAVQLQLRRIVAAAFNELAAETLFRQEALPPCGDCLLDTDLRAVIVAGCAAARDDGERLLGHLPDGACLVEVRESADDACLKLPPAVGRVLAALPEAARVADVIAMAELLGLRGRPLAFGLLCSEVLGLADESAGGTSEWTHEIGVHGGRRDLTMRVPAEALMSLGDAGASGLLRARWGRTTAWVAFEDGRVRQAASSDVKALLGERLAEAGYVTREQIDAALVRQAAGPARPLGHVLMDMGAMGPEALRHAVGAQVLWVARELVSLDAWDEASFTDDEVPDRAPLDIAPDVAEIVHQALASMDEDAMARLAEALAPSRPELRPESLAARFALTDAEQLVSMALSSSTSQILRALEHGDRRDAEVLRVLVMALLATPAQEPATAGCAGRSGQG